MLSLFNNRMVMENLENFARAFARYVKSLVKTTLFLSDSLGVNEREVRIEATGGEESE